MSAKKELKWVVDTVTGCWNVTSHAVNKTHGYISIGRDHQRFLAHRWMYALHVGPIPEGMDILHSCDNTICVNPSHLRAGTVADNMTDKTLKGRAFSKLTHDQVREIFLNTSLSNRELAEKYGVTHGAIQGVKLRTAWRRITDSLLGLGSSSLSANMVGSNSNCNDNNIINRQ